MFLPIPIFFPLFGGGGTGKIADKKHPRLCINCAHFKTDKTLGAEFGRCTRYVTETQELVGAGQWPYADLTRKHGPCGRSGRGFVPATMMSGT